MRPNSLSEKWKEPAQAFALQWLSTVHGRLQDILLEAVSADEPVRDKNVYL